MTTWQGVPALRPGHLIYIGHLGAAHRHQHAAVQLVAVPERSVQLRDDPGARCRAGSG